MDKPMMKTIEQRVAQVLALFMAGLERWYEASLIVVDLIDEDMAAAEVLKRESNGMFNDRMIAAFERMGRKQLAPQLAYMSGAGPERLAKMPFSVQERYLNEPIELLILKDDESTDKLMVSVHDLTPKQATQVFARDCVRTLAAQRAWLEDDRARLLAAAKPVPQFPYKISGRRVTFSEGCTLTAQELARILAQIEH